MERSLTRKESIIRTAIEIIDEMGIQGLSIRELAKREGVTEPAIYRHFKSKQDIILSVLDYFSNKGLEIMKTIKERKQGPKQSILSFIKLHAELFEECPALTSVVFAEEIFRDDHAVAERMKEIFCERSNSIKKLVEEGHKQGEIPLDFDSEDFTDIIMGIMRRITLKWRIRGYSFSLQDKAVSVIETLFKIC